LPFPRSGIVGTSLPSEGLAFFAGGSYKGTWIRDVEIYNASSKTWITMATRLAIGRNSLSAVPLPSRGLVFFAGGYNGGLSAYVDMFNVKTNTWTVFPTGLSQARIVSGASLDTHGLVLFAGGHRVVDMFNANTNAWTVFPTGLSISRSDLAASSLTSQGIVMFGGGDCGMAAGYCCRNVDMYKADSNTWTVFSTGLSVGRCGLAAASLPSQGLIFFAGGYSYSTQTGHVLSRDIDVYNAISNTWAVAPNGLSRGRFRLVGVSLPSQGLILFAGGQENPQDGRSTSRVIDTYNVNTNAWTPLATGLSPGRENPAAASLPSQGLAFFAGGWTGATESDVIDNYDDTAVSVCRRITDVSLTIASSDRVSGTTGKSVTICFTAASEIPANTGTITVNYPSGFFDPGVTFTVVGPITISRIGPSGQSSVVLTVAGNPIPASVICITLAGVTMGTLSQNSDFGITVSTSADRLSAGVASGVLFTQVKSVSFSIASSDRIAGKSPVQVTLAFTPTTEIYAQGSITLIYPIGFFASTGSPVVQISGGKVGTVATPSSTQVVITLSRGDFHFSPGWMPGMDNIPAGAAVMFVLMGLTMGASTSGNSNGIVVTTSSDPSASSGVSSGVIAGQVTNTSFFVSPSDRVAGWSGCQATISFTPTVGGAVVAGGKITLMYPSGFFASGVTATQVALSGEAMVASAAPSTATSIVVTLLSGMLVPSTAVTMTLLGLTTGVAYGGSDSGITVSTSADLIPSVGTASGVIEDPVAWCGT
jgi:hypothetical protein